MCDVCIVYKYIMLHSVNDFVFIAATFLAIMMLVKPDAVEGGVGVILYILQVSNITITTNDDKKNVKMEELWHSFLRLFFLISDCGVYDFSSRPALFYASPLLSSFQPGLHLCLSRPPELSGVWLDTAALSHHGR